MIVSAPGALSMIGIGLISICLLDVSSRYPKAETNPVRLSRSMKPVEFQTRRGGNQNGTDTNARRIGRRCDICSRFVRYAGQSVADTGLTCVQSESYRAEQLQQSVLLVVRHHPAVRPDILHARLLYPPVAADAD